MPSNDKYKWTVGKEVEEDNPVVYDNNPEDTELDKVLSGETDEDKAAKEAEEKAKEGLEKDELFNETSESESGGDPTSNGFDPYADRDGAEIDTHDETTQDTRDHTANHQQREQNTETGDRPIDPLDKPQQPLDGEAPAEGVQPGGTNQPGGTAPQGEVQQPGGAATEQGGVAPDQVPQGPNGGQGQVPEGPGQGEAPQGPQAPQGPAGQQVPDGGQGEGVPRDNGVPTQNPNGDTPSDGGKTPGLDKKDGLDKGPGKESEGAPGKGETGQQVGNTGKPGGNGYGAGKNPNQGQGQGGDPTANARRNLGHQNKVNAGNNPAPKGKGGATGGAGGLGKKGGLGSKGGLGGALGGLKNKLNPFNRGGGGNGAAGDGEGKESSSSSGFVNIMKKAAEFLARHPYAAGIIIVILIIFLICMETEVVQRSSNSNSSSTACTYTLKGVTTSGNINLDSLQVEIVNCDATEEDYTVIETVDFEKYVIGVALAEVSWHADYPAYFQTQIIAARNFALTRNSGMCPSHPDDCFYGYNASTGKIRLRNCSNDQNYCDYDKPCYRKTRGEGEKALVGLEAEGQEGAYVWKNELDDGTKATILASAQEVRGKVLTDTDGNVVKTSYVNTDQENWWSLAQQGKTYQEILLEHYSGQNASGMATATCSNYGNIDYGDYVLDSSDDEILHVPLDQFLSDHGTSLEAFASLISNNVNKAGYGTRAGVVAAAVTLIAELGNNYNVKVPYYWGGGHYDGIVDGVLGYWGSTQCHTYANGQSYDYCGFDCSGFVPWAIKNGGFNIPHMLAGNFQGLSGAQRVSLSSSSPVLLPGDLLESEHHIVLVVGVDEENHQYICAEASGNARGVLFTRRSYADGGYWGVKMDGYYNTHQRSNG